jgi:hypothetical protein
MVNSLTGFRLASSGVNLASSATTPEQRAVVTAPSSSSPNKGSDSKSSTKLLRYPLKAIHNNTDYLQIQIFKFEPPKIDLGRFEGPNPNFTLPESSASQNQKNILRTIYLPIPSGIKDDNTASWNSGTVGPLEGFGISAGLGVVSSGGDIAGAAMEAFSKGSETLKSLMQNSSAQNALQKYFAGSAVQAAGGNVTAQGVVSRFTGNVINNNQELLFEGPGLRSFDFTFDLSPRFAEEAEVVKEIIRQFKKSMAPKKNSVQGLFLGTPDVFGLTYKTGSQPHNFLNQFKICALTNMTTNYAASGAYATYPDGTPVHMQLTLSFQELNPIYDVDYNTPKGEQGVGY